MSSKLSSDTMMPQIYPSIMELKNKRRKKVEDDDDDDDGFDDSDDHDDDEEKHAQGRNKPMLKRNSNFFV